MVAGGIEFDWDAGNTKHLAEHNVTAAEFEQVMNSDPLDMDYEITDGEERYRSVGVTSGGRFLLAVVDYSRWQGSRHHRFPGRRFKQESLS